MTSLFSILLPEIVLVTAACVLFLKGLLPGKLGGGFSAGLALVAMLVATFCAYLAWDRHNPAVVVTDTYGNFRLASFALWLRLVILAIGTLLVLLSWPSGKARTGNLGVDFGQDSGEYFGLLLLALSGLTMVCGANDLIVLFMAIELASIPTYILVSTGRPLPAAQEAGLKYFFLGAFSAAILLMGLAYLYGAFGTTNLNDIAARLHAGANVVGAPELNTWVLFSAVLIVVSLGFKLAAVPLHTYAADVYQGAATAVTAMLGFIPKAVGIIALIKILYVYSGGGIGDWLVDDKLGKLIWILAILTMTVGNLLALTQSNIKRMFAYSSVAHSGYMLAGVAMLTLSAAAPTAIEALHAVLVYLTIYGLMSTAAFGVLVMLPSKSIINVGGKDITPPATTAETLDDVAGVGRQYPLIGIMMAIACFSLIGIPLTAGFWGKYYLISTALSQSGTLIFWLAIALILNSALGASYYLRVVAAMFHRQPVVSDVTCPSPSLGLSVGTGVATLLLLVLGIVLQTTSVLSLHSRTAATTVDILTPIERTADVSMKP
jgi:NADH-quinone oxidoreductase subunit N